MNPGILSALGAFGIWGFMPLYWKAMEQVPALQIMTHRIVWSLLFVALLLLISGRLKGLIQSLKDTKLLLISGSCALLIAVNWLTYIWAVNNGFIIESSLGYFINPIINVIFGVIFLQERLRPLQWLSVALATSGVLYLTFSYGELPWIALTLAFSFAFYGLLRKRSPASALQGLALETAILFLPASGFLLWLGWQQQGSFGQLSTTQDLLMIGCGVITAIPLLLFASAARRISLTTLGIIQYLGPTIQLLIGVWVYQEPFEGERALSFIIIWAALALYTLEGTFNTAKQKLRQHRQSAS